MRDSSSSSRIIMTIRDHLKYFYMKRLKFLRNRDHVRFLKTAAGGALYCAGVGVCFVQLQTALDEKKRCEIGSDSQTAAATMSHVRGLTENKLGNGKTLQGKAKNNL